MTESIRIRCEGCDVKIKAPMKYQGRRVKCPQCGQAVQVPMLNADRTAASHRAPAPVSTATHAGRGAAATPGRAKRPAATPPADDQFAHIDFAEFQDFGPIQDLSATPKPRKPKAEAPADDTPKPVRKKKRKRKTTESYSGGGFYIDPAVFGGLAVMLLGGGIFVWLWNRGIIWPWAGIICIAGLIGMVKGLLGIDDD